MEKSEKKITEQVKGKGEIDNEDMKVIWGYEPMFGVSIVYCYGTLKACEKLGTTANCRKGGQLTPFST